MSRKISDVGGWHASCVLLRRAVRPLGTWLDVFFVSTFALDFFFFFSAQANEGIELLREKVDTLIVIANDKLLQVRFIQRSVQVYTCTCRYGGAYHSAVYVRR